MSKTKKKTGLDIINSDMQNRREGGDISGKTVKLKNGNKHYYLCSFAGQLCKHSVFFFLCKLYFTQVLK